MTERAGALPLGQASPVVGQRGLLLRSVLGVQDRYLPDDCRWWRLIHHWDVGAASAVVLTSLHGHLTSVFKAAGRTYAGVCD